MKKQKQKHSKAYITYEQGMQAKREVREKLRNFRWLLAVKIGGIFLALAALYYILLAMEIKLVTPILYIGAAVLFLVFFFVNRGLSNTVPTAAQLPDTWSEDKKADYIEEDIARKAVAKKIMFILAPVLLLVAVDILSVLVIPLFTTESA